MNELKSLLQAASDLRTSGEPFVVATLVRVRGSSYRRPGARMLVTRDRWIAGSVSGGCLEGDLLKKGWWRTEGGPKVVTYDARAEEDLSYGFGLGCDGVVDVLLERAADEENDRGVDPLRFIDRAFRLQERAVVATVFDAADESIGARLAMRADGAIETDVTSRATRDWLTAACRRALATGESEVSESTSSGRAKVALIEAVRPPPRLVVHGAGHDATAVVAIAKSVGWDVVVVAPDARPSTRDRFRHADALVVGGGAELAACVDESDRAIAVVMSHNYERDRDALAALVQTHAEYIGMLGPRRRTLRMAGELALDPSDARIHAPVGLAIGAETPQEIALAIVAEAQAALTRTSAESLRARRGPIHPRDEDAEPSASAAE